MIPLPILTSLAVVAGAFASIIIGALVFTNAVHRRMVDEERREDERPTRASAAEKRRVLERLRSNLQEAALGAELSVRQANGRRVAELDDQLLALADEEARVGEEEA